MTAENPEIIDTERWLQRARARIRRGDPPRAWKVEDFKLVLLLADRFTRAELLEILDLSTGKRFDGRTGIETFHRLLAERIDARGDA